MNGNESLLRYFRTTNSGNVFGSEQESVKVLILGRFLKGLLLVAQRCQKTKTRQRCGKSWGFAVEMTLEGGE